MTSEGSDDFWRVCLQTNSLSLVVHVMELLLNAALTFNDVSPTLRMHNDLLWCVLQPSKAYQTVSSSILLYLCWDCALICFGVSHNLARCSKQSVSQSRLLCTWCLLIHYGSLLVSTINFYLTCECSMIHSGVSCNLARHSGQSWLHPFTNTSGLDSHGCPLICFGASRNLVRCSEQSVIVIFSLWCSTSDSRLLALIPLLLTSYFLLPVTLIFWHHSSLYPWQHLFICWIQTLVSTICFHS